MPPAPTTQIGRGCLGSSALYEIFTHSSQAVNASRVFVEKLLLICFRSGADDFKRGRDPLPQSACHRANRPIAAPDYTIPTKTFDSVFDVRAHCLRGSITGFAICKDARNLARHIRQQGDLADVI